MNSNKIKWMVTTAVLLALTVVFQYLRLVFGAQGVSPYIIGTLVNVCLIIAAMLVGVWGGVAVGVLAPVIAWLQGYAQIVMVPWIVAGNIVLVVLYALLVKPEMAKDKACWLRWALAGVLAALVKWVIIALGVTVMLGKGFVLALTVVQLQQFVTALIAMVVAKLVLIALPKTVWCAGK